MKQKRFAVEYLSNGGNGTKAAIVAYPNTTRSTAQTLGGQLPHNEKVVEFMRELMDQVGLSDKETVVGLRTIVKAGLTKRALRKSGTKEALAAIRMSHELKDNFPSQRKIIDKRTIELKTSLEGKTNEDVRKMIQEKIDELKSVLALKEKYARQEAEENLKMIDGYSA